MSFMEKVAALLKSRRFYAAVGGVVAVIASNVLGLDEATVTGVVTVVIGWIIGDSINKTGS